MRRFQRGAVPLRLILLSSWEDRLRRVGRIHVLIAVLVYLLFLLAMVWFFGRSPDRPMVPPIPIRMVREIPEPPPPKPPEPPQPKQQQPEPPRQQPPPKAERQPLASDDFGDVTAKGKEQVPSEGPSQGQRNNQSGQSQPAPGTKQPADKPNDVAPDREVPDPEQSEAVKQAELEPTPERRAAGGERAPPPPAPSPHQYRLTGRDTPRPAPPTEVIVRRGGAREPAIISFDADRDEGRPARYPGPNAMRDEYLAYLRDLIRENVQNIPPEVLRRQWRTVTVSLTLEANGHLGPMAVVQSTGDQGLDAALIQVLRSIPPLPPVPPELHSDDGSAAPLYFSSGRLFKTPP